MRANVGTHTTQFQCTGSVLIPSLSVCVTFSSSEKPGTHCPPCVCCFEPLLSGSLLSLPSSLPHCVGAPPWVWGSCSVLLTPPHGTWSMTPHRGHLSLGPSSQLPVLQHLHWMPSSLGLALVLLPAGAPCHPSLPHDGVSSLHCGFLRDP